MTRSLICGTGGFHLSSLASNSQKRMGRLLWNGSRCTSALVYFFLHKAWFYQPSLSMSKSKYHCVGPSGCSDILDVRSIRMQPSLDAPCLEGYSEDAEPIWFAISNPLHLQMHSLLAWPRKVEQGFSGVMGRDYCQGLLEATS